MRVGFLFAVSFFLFLKSLYLFVVQIDMVFKGCLRYCKSTSFQANHNARNVGKASCTVVCDTANVRVFKQITTIRYSVVVSLLLFAILQMYEFSSKSQLCLYILIVQPVVCDTANVRVFKQITTLTEESGRTVQLFAILQMYEFSSKSQLCIYFFRANALFAILQMYEFSSKSQH